MNRYQFEAAISAYIENDLNLSERQAFESYMDSNPDSKALVKNIRSTMQSVKGLNDLKTSSVFMSNLFKRIEFEKNRPSKRIVERPAKSIFGFTPLYASLMAVLVASFIGVGVNLWPENSLLENTTPAFTGNITSTPANLGGNPVTEKTPILVANETKTDSADTTINNKKNFRLDDNVKFVKKQR